MSVVHAIFENGVFKPTDPVDLPERTKVEFEPKVVISEEEDRANQEAIYALLKQSFASGETNVAERHNEHQP
ncbi:MAG TPA: antitoxin family protein [Tepidisphaeraceae bacterium]|jgi:predicted DNA-binding antitoxin AbrB/MazE fold protein